jgi:hypothetical protein
MESYYNFRQSMFLHEKQTDNKKEELGSGATMEGKLWSVFEEKD